VLGLFGLQRLIELGYSRRNERLLTERQTDALEAGRVIFPLIVAVNLALFTLPAMERWLRRRPAPPSIAGTGLVLALAGFALRLSVLATLRTEWNVRALVPTDLRVVDRGPYRFIRHPNYVALGLEFLGLPLMGGAYWTATGLSAANALVLWRRITEEEALLLAIPEYRRKMAGKPRFIPRLISGR
jgi:methyltransferase